MRCSAYPFICGVYEYAKLIVQALENKVLSRRIAQHISTPLPTNLGAEFAQKRAVFGSDKPEMGVRQPSRCPEGRLEYVEQIRDIALDCRGAWPLAPHISELHI
jgi:hypothetical protein